jgi:3-hydroxyacyl-CoA dehydrogenase
MMETTTFSRTRDLTATYQPFRKAAVLGAGTMGAQIAAHLANAGLSVVLLDLAAEGDDPRAHVEKLFQRAKNASPDPFFTEKTARRVTLGTFEEDWDQLEDADWIIEAVVEKMAIKQDLMERVDEVLGEETVVSTNTSGLSVNEIAENRSSAFQSRFLGTHFFNPPRYLKLLELVPTANTAPEVVERVERFGRVHLGKGVVRANDTPSFIANRIGVYALMQAVRAFTDGDYTIEEIDTLTGTIAGREKSATFRTADLVGLDVMKDVADTLVDKLSDSQGAERYQLPPLVEQLVDRGSLGDKADEGFYKKVDGEIRSINPDTLEYESPGRKRLENLEEIKAIEELDERLQALYTADGRVGRFFRDHILNILNYSARCIPQVTDHPADVDRAIRWGFGWKKGPFETWDALGFDRVLDDLRAGEYRVPDWVEEMEGHGASSFYRGRGDDREVYRPGDGYVEDPLPPDEIRLDIRKADPANILWTNPEAELIDLGDGVALYEFQSKGNSLGREVIEGLLEVIERVEQGEYRGLVIGNEGKSFSYGANLGEITTAATRGAFDRIDRMIELFQRMTQRIRYSSKPVVVTVHQRVLGGGCEMVMSSPFPVAAAESYIGLVELGVGVIPAGGGCMMLAARAHERAATEHPSQIQDHLRPLFETVGKAEVATSARQAQAYGFLPDHARLVMNDARRFYVAKREVIRLFEEGYAPPPRRTDIKVLGRPTRAAFESMAHNLKEGGYASAYDAYLAKRLAYVLTGGDIVGPTFVDEAYLLELEREVFMSLLGEKKTQERMTHMLLNKEPLRN